MKKEKKLVTAEELAKVFDVHPHIIYRWAREGLIPCVRPGDRRTVRFNLKEVIKHCHRPAKGRP